MLNRIAKILTALGIYNTLHKDHIVVSHRHRVDYEHGKIYFDGRGIGRIKAFLLFIQTITLELKIKQS